MILFLDFNSDFFYDFFFNSEALAYHAAVQMSPAMYNQIVDECDELARYYAMGEKETATINKNHDD